MRAVRHSDKALRRPAYRDPLLQHLGARQRKSLLVLDEAHTGAPSTASKYAIDSRITRVVRDVAPRFENRLFLSATPHNGHSNSFSALLELLDPQRFTRGVNVGDPKQLEPVMVRRLKEDLRKLGIEGFPERKVLQIDLSFVAHENGAWTCRYPKEKPRVLASDPAHEPMELLLSEKLREYADAAEPKSGKGKLVFINLQKRLLSSFEAFYRTLQAHARSVGKASASAETQAALFVNEDEEYGIDDETQEEADAAEIEQASKSLPAPEAKAKKLLEELVNLAEQYRGAPDAKVLALLDWIRENQCPAVQLGGALSPSAARSEATSRSEKPRGWGPAASIDVRGNPKDLKWTDRRVILFTEWGDTKRYLWQILTAAVQGTDRADERILQFHGGMSPQEMSSARKCSGRKRTSGSIPRSHPHRDRRRPRGREPPGTLRGPLPLRHPVEPRAHGAAERAHRPDASGGPRGPLPLLLLPGPDRGPRPEEARGRLRSSF